MSLKRIIIHWTAGQNTPNDTDKRHYHFIIDGDGKVHTGRYKPEDNLDCTCGGYAAHTGGGNTGSIGVALCGMLGFCSAKQVGSCPLTKKQCEASFKFIAELCKKYNIAVTPQTLLTHKEFGDANPKTTSCGKIDICYLPPYPEVQAKEIGDFIRNKVKWYMQKL